MNSPFANIFIALQQQVQTQVPAIAYIDQDLGQFREEPDNNRPPVSWPCLLIDFERFDYEEMGGLAQTAKGIIALRLGFTPLSSSSSSTPDVYLQRAISYYDIECTLHQAVQGWSPGANYGRLTRITAHTHHRRKDYIRVRELQYAISFQDYSAKVAMQNVPAAINATAEIDIPVQV